MSSFRKRVSLILLLLPGAGLIVLFIGLVIGMAISQSFGYFNFVGESRFSLEYWNTVLSDSQTWKFFFYSFRVALLSSVLSVFLAYPFALWLRKPFRGSAFIGGIMKIPMLVPGLVAAFLYVNIISYHGFFNEMLVRLGLIKEPLRMQNDRYAVGVIILQIWKQMPFALLLISGSVRAIGDDILDAARDLGAGAWARFWKIITPLTLRILQVSMIIIFIGAAGDFSFQAIAGPVNLNSMSQYMVLLQSEMGQWNSAAVIAVMLMILSLFGSIALALLTQVLVKRRREQL